MNRRWVVALSLALALVLASAAAAGPPHGLHRGLPVVKVFLDGSEVATDVPAVILDGRTMVPLRAVAEMFGAQVEWDPQAYAVRITRQAPAVPEAAVRAEQALVTRVIDGDTVEVQLAGKAERVRLIGVDCPELGTEEGAAARDFTERALAGKAVYLEADVEARDRYGRLLAYVWLSPPAAGTGQEVRARMFNARLLLAGMAQLMTVPPNVKYADWFAEFQREAREAGAGLWGGAAAPRPGESGVTVYVTETGSKYHREGCRYLSKSAIPVSLEEAKRRGYAPCSVCDPPE